jgi:hypothetical protein
MSENKTVKNNASVEDFLNAVEHATRKKDAFTLLEMMKEITGEQAAMWGDSIVGFGEYHYKYDSGREGDFLMIGFSPRKTSTTLYIMNGFDRYDELLGQLGKHKTGRSCLYITNLKNVDLDVLQTLIKESYNYMNDKYHK